MSNKRNGNGKSDVRVIRGMRMVLGCEYTYIRRWNGAQ